MTGGARRMKNFRVPPIFSIQTGRITSPPYELPLCSDQIDPLGRRSCDESAPPTRFRLPPEIFYRCSLELIALALVHFHRHIPGLNHNAFSHCQRQPSPDLALDALV